MPNGSDEISHPVIHREAGGTGTYADPITLAVGHSMVEGKDILDFPAGTRFYLSYLRRYFIVEDTCGDGASPQNVPCHDLRHAPPHATAWIDVYIGGSAVDSPSEAQACARKLTSEDHLKLREVLMAPPAGLPVVAGQLVKNGVTRWPCTR